MGSLEKNLSLDGGIGHREGIGSRDDSLVNADPLDFLRIFELLFVLIKLSLLFPKFMVRESHEIRHWRA